MTMNFAKFTMNVVWKRKPCFSVVNHLPADLKRSHYSCKFDLVSSCNAERCFSTKNPVINSKENKLPDEEKSSQNILGRDTSRFDIFRDDDSQIILDVDEERELRKKHPELFEETKETIDPLAGMNLERGLTGVFDIEDLVEVLKKENAEDIMVIKVPPEYHYVDYMVIVTGRSFKHMYSIVEFVRKLFKRKRHQKDRIPDIEGKESKQWIAIDLGNIALHVLSKSARSYYDIDTLWSVGPTYDSRLNQKEDPLVTLLQEHTTSLDGFEPLPDEESSDSGTENDQLKRRE